MHPVVAGQRARLEIDRLEGAEGGLDIGQPPIAAGHQALTRIVRRAQFEQIAHVKQVELRLLLLDQRRPHALPEDRILPNNIDAFRLVLVDEMAEGGDTATMKGIYAALANAVVEMKLDDELKHIGAADV